MVDKHNLEGKDEKRGMDESMDFAQCAECAKCQSVRSEPQKCMHWSNNWSDSTWGKVSGGLV